MFDNNIEFFDYVVFQCIGNPTKASGSIFSRIFGAMVIPIGGGELKKELEARNVIRHTKSLHLEAEKWNPSSSQMEFELNRRRWSKIAREECRTPMTDIEDAVKSEGPKYVSKLSKEFFEG